MIDQNFLVHSICEEHFLLQNFSYISHFLIWNNFHPFFEGFPFTEGNKEIVFTNLIECLYFFKPFLNSNKLNRLCWNKFADTFTTKSIIILNFIFDNFWIRNNLHIIMVILCFFYHINKLISCEFLLPNHFEKCGYLCIVNWIVHLFHIFLRDSRWHWLNFYWL